jgi:hypothetical protein
MMCACVMLCLPAALAGEGAPPGDDNGDATVIELAPRGLPGGHATLSQSDLDGTNDIDVSDGCVLSNQSVRFSRDGSNAQELTVGPHRLTMIYDSGRKDFRLKMGDKESALKEQDEGLRPVVVDLDGTKTALGFPYANTYYSGAYVYYRSGCAMRGELGGERIYLYDDDLNLEYSEKADTFRRDDGMVFAPIRKVVSLGDQAWRILSVKPDGTALAARPYEGERGGLEVRLYADDGVEFDCAFAGAECSFTASEEKETFAVPPGAYNILYGVAWQKKKGRRYVVAGIVPGRSEAVEVAAGEESEIRIGRKIGLRFSASVVGPNLTIDASDVDVVGDQGEEYVDFEWDGSPDVYVVAGKSPSKVGSFGFG